MGITSVAAGTALFIEEGKAMAEGAPHDSISIAHRASQGAMS
jgi:hypothetical protein